MREKTLSPVGMALFRLHDEREGIRLLVDEAESSFRVCGDRIRSVEKGR
jgi:hypothetical protein